LINSATNIQPSWVSFITGTKSTKLCIFDNLEFNTEVIDTNDVTYATGPFVPLDKLPPTAEEVAEDGLPIQETIDSIEFKNSYQLLTTPVKIKGAPIPVPPPTNPVIPNASRLIRGWTMAVPLSPNTGRRFVDSFLSIKMVYNNSTNKLFKLHDVITYIREANK